MRDEDLAPRLGELYLPMVEKLFRRDAPAVRHLPMDRELGKRLRIPRRTAAIWSPAYRGEAVAGAPNLFDILMSKEFKRNLTRLFFLLLFCFSPLPSQRIQLFICLLPSRRQPNRG